MKLVKEILYEKFTEEGDPLADMSIGQNFYKDKIMKLLPLRYGSYGVDYVALVKYTLFDPETTVEESKDHVGRTMYTIKCHPKEANPFYNYLSNLVTNQTSNIYTTKQIGTKRGKTDALIIVMDDAPKPTSVHEKFTEKGDPIADMGIGLKKSIINRAVDAFKDAQDKDDVGDGIEGFRIVEIKFDAFTTDIITNYPVVTKVVQYWLIDVLKTHELDEFFELETSITHSESDDHIFWSIDFKEKYEMIFSITDHIVINYQTIDEIS